MKHRRPPQNPVCPRCGKRTRHLEWAGPDWDHDGDDMWAYHYDCVQCDGRTTEYGLAPEGGLTKCCGREPMAANRAVSWSWECPECGRPA